MTTEAHQRIQEVVDACRYQPPAEPLVPAKRHVDTLYAVMVANHRWVAVEMWDLLDPPRRRLARGSMLERFAVRWWIRILPMSWRKDMRARR